MCYNKEVPFEIKIGESENIPKETGSLENITVKLLVLVSLMFIHTKKIISIIYIYIYMDPHIYHKKRMFNKK